MSNVTLQIGGRGYQVACAAGEEDHIASLGRMIDDKVREMGTAGQNEVRILLFAALLLADELHEIRQGSADRASQGQAALLEAIAGRLENCALALEGQA